MQDKTAKTFAVRLAELIQKTGATKKAIAERAGIHPVTLSKYLSGKRIPATEELHNLASVLRITTEWLLTGNGDPKPVNLDQVLALEAEARRAASAPPAESSAKPKDSGGDSRALERLFEKLISEGDPKWLLDALEELQPLAIQGDSQAQELINRIMPRLRARLNESTPDPPT